MALQPGGLVDVTLRALGAGEHGNPQGLVRSSAMDRAAAGRDAPRDAENRLPGDAQRRGEAGAASNPGVPGSSRNPGQAAAPVGMLGHLHPYLGATVLCLAIPVKLSALTAVSALVGLLGYLLPIPDRDRTILKRPWDSRLSEIPRSGLTMDATYPGQTIARDSGS
jgi:hypothetical protein